MAEAFHQLGSEPARGGGHRRRRDDRRHGVRGAQQRRRHRPANLLVVLNDNDMSISPNVGALNNYLARLMSGKFYAAARRAGEKVLSVAPPIRELAKRAEEHMKGMVTPGTLFEEFGFNYIGPIDGHDLDVLLDTLSNIKQLSGPQFLHVVTKKGKGYKPWPKPTPACTTACRASTRKTASPKKPAASRPTPRCSATGCATWPPPTRGWSASPRRCAKAPAWCAFRRNSRSAISTSASPSSTR
jgi:hypothetical protein